MLSEILVIGGTGAQGFPTVKALSESGRYSVRVLSRNVNSERAVNLSLLRNVRIVQGSVNNEHDLHEAFRDVYGAFVNTDGFTLGEKNEMFYAIRAYEIARHEGVQHFIWSNTDYALKKAGWDEQYHWGHNDAGGRVGDFILAQKQDGMKASLITVPPYMDMLFDGMYLPEEEEDGLFVWANPAANGKIPLMALDDLGAYVLWALDNPAKSAGMDLEVATEQISFPEIASTFTRVTGRKAVHRRLPLEVYLPKAEPFPNAPANWATGPNAQRDEGLMTWRENFTAWWKFWSTGKGATRDMDLLDDIHPTRIKTLEEWMKKVNYQGKRKYVLKGLEDLQSPLGGSQGNLVTFEG